MPHASLWSCGIAPAWRASPHRRSAPHGTSSHNSIEFPRPDHRRNSGRSEEHTSELQSLMRISYAVFCLKKKNKTNIVRTHTYNIRSKTDKTNKCTKT